MNHHLILSEDLNPILTASHIYMQLYEYSPVQSELQMIIVLKDFRLKLPCSRDLEVLPMFSSWLCF